MKTFVMKGLGYGLTSGIITTLGMMVGLNAGTHSKVAVLGGIFIIAIGDSLSDALGMHIFKSRLVTGLPLIIRGRGLRWFLLLFLKFYLR